MERHRLTQAYLVPTMYARLRRLPEEVKKGSMLPLAYFTD